MGIQDDFKADVTLASDVVRVNPTADTIDYVADLLSELSTIANIGGLTDLSDDINVLLSKHAAR